MRLVVELAHGITREQADQLAAAVGTLLAAAGAQVRVEDPPPIAPPSDPRLVLRKLEDTSRLMVANWLGQHVATVGPLEAALCMTLHECHGVFRGSKVLYEALQVWPAWKGQRHQVRQVYGHLRRKLAKTRYPLLAGRGVYGFVARAVRGGGPTDLWVTEREDTPRPRGV